MSASPQVQCTRETVHIFTNEGHCHTNHTRPVTDNTDTVTTHFPTLITEAMHALNCPVPLWTATWSQHYSLQPCPTHCYSMCRVHTVGTLAWKERTLRLYYEEQMTIPGTREWYVANSVRKKSCGGKDRFCLRYIKPWHIQWYCSTPTQMRVQYLSQTSLWPSKQVINKLSERQD